MTLLSFSHRAACAPLIRRGKAFFSLFLVCAGILSVSGAQLTLSWKDNSNNETGFKIERSLDGTTFSQIAAVGANTVSYTNTGLADATRYHYRVRAYNAAGNSGYTNVSNAVTAAPPPPPAVNAKPTLSVLSDQTINEDATSSLITFTVTDVETASGSLVVTGASSNTTLIPVTGLTFGGSGSNRTLQIKPAANRFGTATITVSVSDGQDSTSRQFLLTVNSVNDTPTLSAIPNQTIDQDTGTSPIPCTVADQETAASSLTLTRSSSNTGLIPLSGIAFGGSGSNRTVTVTPAASKTGTATLTIQVSDGQATASRSFTVKVVAVAPPPLPPPPANTAPTITSIANQTINEDGTTGPIAFKVADLESANSSLTLSASSSNTTLVPLSRIIFGGASTDRTVQINPAGNKSGTAMVTVTVSDGQLTASRSFQVTVNPVNDKPTIGTIANQTISQGGSTGPIAFTVGDSDNATSTLTVSGSSSNTTLVPVSGMVFGGSGGSRTVTITPASAQSGFADITIQVSDGLLTATRTFRVTLEAVVPPPPPPPTNTAPTITSIANRTINEDTTTGPIAFKVADGETANGSLTLSASSSNTTLVPVGGIVFGGSGTDRTVQVNPASNRSGAATITVVVSDGSLTASRAFQVTVNAVNDAPTVSNITNKTIVQGSSTGPIAFTVGDPDTALNSLILTADSTNRTLVPLSAIVFAGSGQSRTVSVTPASGQSGDATITVRVSDGSLEAVDTFRLTVTPLDAVTVSLTAPTTGSTVSFGSAVTLSAVVSDVARTTRVEFFDGATKLGQDATHPYAFTWSSPGVGSHSLKAKVIDTSGLSRESSAVAINVVAETALTVAMKTPSADESIVLGQTMALEAIVSGPKASIQSVDFYVGSTLIRKELLTPYTASWKPATAGTYSLWARVISTSGATSDSPIRTITVAPPAVTVSLVSPVNNATHLLGQTISMEALVSTIAETKRVDFFDGTSKIKSEYYSPYLFDWTPAAPGTHSITAKVFDNAGNVRTSGTAQITVQSPVVKVALASPKAGTSIEVNTVSTLRVSVDAPGISITRMEFYLGSAKLGQDATAPYTFNWRPDTLGDFALKVRMVSSTGSIVDSASVPVVVVPPPVTVNLTAPSLGQVFPVGASVTLAATVSDASRVDRVQFHSEDGLLGEDASEPYTLTWKPSVQGTVDVFARAIEKTGASRDSTRLAVTIEGAPPVKVTMTNPQGGQSVLVGEAIRVSAVIDVDPVNVSKIDFYAGSKLIKTEFNTPYDFMWTPTEAGDVTIRASARNTAGTRYQSDTVTLSVLNPPILVEVTKPEAGAYLALGETVVIEASVSDLAQTDRIEFLVNGEVVGDDFDYPFSYVQPLSSAGDHTVRVKAISLDGTETFSDRVAFTVGASPLTINLVEPANGLHINAGDPLKLEASPSDFERTASVTFLVDGEVVGNVGEAPFVLDWIADGAGVREIQAQVVDLEGNGSFSEVAYVTVDTDAGLESGVYRGVFVDPSDDSTQGTFAMSVSIDLQVTFIGYAEPAATGFVSESLSLSDTGLLELSGDGDAGPVRLTAQVDPDAVTGEVESLGLILRGSRVSSGMASGVYRLLGITSSDTEVWLMVDADGAALAGVSQAGRFRGETVISTPAALGWSITSERFGIDVSVDEGNGVARGYLDRPEGGLWLAGLRRDVATVQRIDNLSTRGFVLPGNSPMIVGFVIEGEGPKTVLIRGVGPGLADFGLTNALEAPSITLKEGATVLDSNQGWFTEEAGETIEVVSERVGAFVLDRSSADAAILRELAPGRYTAIVRDALSLGGDTLVEIYDADEGYPMLSELRSLSTRGPVGDGKNLIGGFVITGNSPKRILIRGVGPALSAFDVSDALASARLVLTERVEGEDVTIGENLGWSTDPQAALIAEIAAKVGAFPLDPGSQDSALLLWLEPGAYTFIVQPGTTGQTGTALVEVYQTD